MLPIFVDFRGQAGGPRLGATLHLATPRKIWNMCVIPSELNLQLEEAQGSVCFHVYLVQEGLTW